MIISAAEHQHDIAGEMVRAMSAQKRDLNRRLKAAENSNRQLRSELQHYRGLPHMSHSADPQQGSVGGIRGVHTCA